MQSGTGSSSVLRRSRLTGMAAGAALVTALGFAGALLAAPPAQAHNYLVASTPEAGGVLTELPERFELTTNEGLLDFDGTASGFALQVSDAEGSFYGDGCVTVSAATMSVEAPALGGGGVYELAYQFVSADGHTVSDSFDFTWDPPADHEPVEGSDSAPNCGRAEAPSGSGAEGDETGADAAAGDSAVVLGDVLWAGGAILAVLAAGGITLAVLMRRRPASGAGGPDVADRPSSDSDSRGRLEGS